MRSLSPEEIEEVDEIMRERHPLYYTKEGILSIFPGLKWILCCLKNKHEQILPRDIERSDNQSDINSDKASVEDKLGFGIVAYFDLQKYLLVLFLIIFILLLPSIYLYVNYPYGRRDGSIFLNKYSIGNLGFSNVLCKDTSLKVGNLTMSCPTGEIRQIVSFGLTPSDAVQNDACMPNQENLQ